MKSPAVLNETSSVLHAGQVVIAEEVQRFVSRPEFVIRHTLNSDCDFQPHSHSVFTIVAVLNGRMSVVIGDRAFDLVEGLIGLINVGQMHSARTSRVEFVSIGLSPVLVNQLVSEIGVMRTSSEIVFRRDSITDERILQIAKGIVAELSANQPGEGAMIDALVRQLAIHLLRHHLTVRKSDKIEFSRAGPVDRRLRRAIEFMHDNFSSEIALEEIAAAAYLSEYHFARLFKQICGVTPHVYLANLRLDRARKLLAESPMSISEIASVVGYQSQSHFTKMFKAVTGITPRVYRESAK